jgi:HK97 family phage major capsid protein
MTWRELLTQANAKANEAKAIYAKDDGDLDRADSLMREAEDMKKRGLGIQQAEGGFELPEPESKAQILRAQMQDGGFTNDQINVALKALDGSPPERPAKARDNGAKLPSFGQFLKAIRLRQHSRLVKEFGAKQESDSEVKDLLESGGATGGYLVPTEYLSELLLVPDSEAVVRPRARKVPMRRRSMVYPMLDQDGTPSAYWDLQYYGGVYAVWTAEAGSKTEVEPAFKQGELVAHKLAGYTQASDELLDDNAYGLQSLLMELFRGAIVTREDFAFLRGTGVGMPMGILQSGALVTQNRATANTISYNDLTRMVENMLPSSFGNAVWIADLTALGALLRIVDAGSNAAFIVNAQGGIAQSIPGTILGRPLIVTEKLPNLGSTGDLCLFDLSYYLIGDRQATTIAASEHYAFTNDLTTWRFVHRVDGQPWLDAPIYIDTTNTVSPFVALHANTTS